MLRPQLLVAATCLATLLTAAPVLSQEIQEVQEDVGHTEIGGLLGIGVPAATEALASVEGWFYVSAFFVERIMVGGELGLGGSVESRQGLARYGGSAAFLLKRGGEGPYVLAGLSGIFHSPHDLDTGVGFGVGYLKRLGRGRFLRAEARILRLSEYTRGFDNPSYPQGMLLIGIGKRLGI
ncbi:hypothetical protein [Candidatus Palauibacter sp.]|uniref:hypothetical protein n=1 Tax=Candidatus Palauibacter sp. TaxID=3101350 RepID=UPI003B01927F